MTRIAIAQIASSTEKSANLKLAKELISEAKRKNAGIVAFPEFLMAFSPGNQSPAELAELAESIDGPFIESLSETARHHGIQILATIYEKCNIENRVYDTSFWINGLGMIVCICGKLSL